MRIDRWLSNLLLAVSLLAFVAPSAHAIELNWSGQFWSEFHYIKNYTLDGSDGGANLDPARSGQSGYYVPAGGSNNASFETLFLRLRPKLVVNDNVYIKSELWAGDPTFGVFGNAVPYSADQRQFHSNQSRGSSITFQRFWAEFLSDFGTVQVGRTPLDWGLGLVWNSGEELFSRYASTGDTLRLVSKFGAFTFAPSFVLHSTGNALGGGCNFGSGAVCLPGNGSGAVADYSLALKYENLEEDFEGGVNLMRRIASNNQDNGSNLGPSSGATQSAVNHQYNIWDIYAKKKVGKFSLAGELPITNGTVGGLDYSAYGIATEVNWNMTDMWETRLRAGRASGQPNSGSGTPDNVRMFFFNPNYHVGMVMFNYQLANLVGPNTQNSTAATASMLRSPFDNPISNANYLSLAGLLKTQKWTFNAGLLLAGALQTAKAGDTFFYNTWERKMVQNTSGKDQGSSLGTELDFGAAFQWDEAFTFRLDTGLWFPGSYYAFSNTAVDNATDMVFGTVARVGINF